MEQITQAIKDIVRTSFDVSLDQLELTRPKPSFGDLSSTVALSLAKQIGQPPRDIAQKIADGLRAKNPSWLEAVDIAGPGFINFTLQQQYLVDQLKAPQALPYTGKKIVIETNCPNPFKEIHIGHAMNAIVADSVANLLDAGGADVARVSYHGDVGLHVAKSLWAIRDEFGDNMVEAMKAITEAQRPIKLREWYAKGANAYADDEQVKAEVEELVKQTFAFTDKDLEAVYTMGKEWSFAYFDKAFAELGNVPIIKRYLESAADAEGRRQVEEHIGDVFEKSGNAVIFPGEKYGLHTRVFISGRGTTLYEARDLGLLVLKDQDFAPDLSYIVTAEEQREYFKVIFKAVALLSPHMEGKTAHICTGTVKLTTGKMSSRTGDVVSISWLFDTLRDAVRERGAEGDTVEHSMLAALRYSLLKNRLTSDTVFDINQAVSLEGNTGPYLQYAHARACSIVTKSSMTPEKLGKQKLQAEERALLYKLTAYTDAVSRAVEELMPHHITTYLYELCKEFNAFYENNRVIGDERETIRLGLVEVYADTLKRGLGLLGITAPEKL